MLEAQFQRFLVFMLSLMGVLPRCLHHFERRSTFCCVGFVTIVSFQLRLHWRWRRRHKQTTYQPRFQDLSPKTKGKGPGTEVEEMPPEMLVSVSFQHKMALKNRQGKHIPGLNFTSSHVGISQDSNVACRNFVFKQPRSYSSILFFIFIDKYISP